MRCSRTRKSSRAAVRLLPNAISATRPRLKPASIVRGLVVPLLFLSRAAAAAEVSIGTAQEHEYCLHVTGGHVLKYTFESDQPLRFNVHYHDGQAIHYPVPPKTAKRDAGELTIAVTREVCLMWRNVAPGRATLGFEAAVSR